MNLGLIKSFAVLGDTLHFGLAAKQLNISQPSLTKQMSRLEDLLGARLFHRTRQGTELTAFGKQFLEEVMPVIRHADAAWEHGLQGARGERGRIEFGFTFSAVEVLTDLITAFKKSYPLVEMTFNDTSSRLQESMIIDRRLDLGFVRMPIGSELASMKVGKDRLAFVYPAQFADRISELNSDVVREFPFVGLQLGKAPGTESYIQRLFTARKLEVKTVHRVNESLTQLTMISAGLGFSLMHESALLRVIDYLGGVAVKPIEDPIASWDVGLIWRHNEPNPAVRQFVQLARDRLASGERSR